MTRVAFLGLGAMGRPMAARLLEAGHDLRVWNRTPGRDTELVAAGAVRAATPAEAATDVAVAITMLADPPALEAVLFGPDGVAGTIPSSATLIDMSTVGPSAIRAAAERLAPVAVLDAPVLGSVPHAEGGTLTMLVGGDSDVVDRHAALLGLLGTALHVGLGGAGATVKLAANAAAISSLVGVAEVLALTDRDGLDPEIVLDALEAGPLASLIARWRDRIARPSGGVNFRLALARKDLGLVIDEASRVGLELRVPSAAATRFDEAVASGRQDDDFSSVAAAVRS